MSVPKAFMKIAEGYSLLQGKAESIVAGGESAEILKGAINAFLEGEREWKLRTAKQASGFMDRSWVSERRRSAWDEYFRSLDSVCDGKGMMLFGLPIQFEHADRFGDVVIMDSEGASHRTGIMGGERLGVDDGSDRT